MALNAKRVIFAVALKVQIEDIYQLLVLEVFNFFHALKAFVSAIYKLKIWLTFGTFSSRGLFLF